MAVEIVGGGADSPTGMSYPDAWSVEGSKSSAPWAISRRIWSQMDGWMSSTTRAMVRSSYAVVIFRTAARKKRTIGDNIMIMQLLARPASKGEVHPEVLTRLPRCSKNERRPNHSKPNFLKKGVTLAFAKFVDPLQIVFAVQFGRKPHGTRCYRAAPIALILSM